ncbi:arf-GAP with SH3 domain, ANK repeat and PH domain-containing protein 2-like isoform X2 [Sinocyclocheilus grahami]|uniref:arf-GAP with SH3 domain, ANK repeat and PH domain-containing protein 2-like isoform X2 n=1 Tax=Sinocyclocheilus grahami TaxID=75366 RepID=UPI0007AD4F9A|nr:PREDICTED: arf-GAP with SH3 domain, ANK repeat and PH domain-containing protein 2-like isoform X2 [Sinocyclocheilus grahami]
MPEFISVDDFIAETLEDYSSPTTSSFYTKMTSCRNSAYNIEEALDSDRTILQKMKKAAKAKHISGQDHISHLESYINSMEKLAVNFCNNGEQEVASAFNKFAEFSKELLPPMKNLFKSMLHNVNFFLDSLVKGDLKEVKGDLKKPFDKAWRDYENKFTKIEKEKRELAKQYGMVRTEVSGGEIAEEMEKERRMFQLQMCEYLIKVNEIKTKKGVDLLQNLIKHYHSQCNFFQECLAATEKLKQYIDVLTGQLSAIKHQQDDEKRQLCSLRDQLRPALLPEFKEQSRRDSLSRQTVYSMHQLQGNKQYGTDKSGYLYKRSDGLRKMWQKRKCTVQNCYLTIAHGTPNKSPAKLNLLTCQVKPSLEDKKCFDLISHNRTYHFLADDESDCVAWISVLTNSKQEALNVALDERRQSGENSVEDLTRAITEDIRRMPGNNVCCDCGAPDPSWISINLGILTCIECSGIHREMGVHYSRIQSLSLDKLGTSELLLARNVGNSGFNEIVEASLPSPSVKPSAESDMAIRKDFILSKYMEWQFAQHSGGSLEIKRKYLQDAVRSRDVFSLLQLYAERMDFSLPLPCPLQEKGETALHLAVLLSDRTSLHVADFLFHNCNNLDAQNVKGNTALHYCCQHNKTECLKLLLRAKANTHIKNDDGETGLDMARRLKHMLCEELIHQSQNNQFNMHVHVEYEWKLRQDDLYESDEDLDDKMGPVKKERLGRPFSLYHSSSASHGGGGSSGGGLFNVGRRLAMARGENRRDVYDSPNSQTRSIDSPPPPPPSSPAPPLPPRVRAPNIPPPPPPMSSPDDWTSHEVSSSKKRTPPPPLVIRHKRTYSEPAPQVPPSPHSTRQGPTDYGVPAGARSFGGPDSPFQKCVSGSPKYTTSTLNSLSELPERGFRADGESSSSHFLYQTPQPISSGGRHTPALSPTSPRSFSLEANGSSSSSCHTAPHPLPRKTLMKSKLKRVKAMYDCVADHHDELSFNEGEVLVVLGEEDADWWHGYVEGQSGRMGLFPASFVSMVAE